MRYLLFLLSFIAFIPQLADAATSDKLQNANLVADSSTLNYKTRIGIYRGHVKMTQGTTTIIADEVTTYANKQNQLERAIAIGKPASYSTLPDNSKLLFTAVGNTINYYPLKGYVELIGQAQATQGNDSFAGPRINYDIKQQIVISPPDKTGHTTIIIQPQQKLNS